MPRPHIYLSLSNSIQLDLVWLPPHLAPAARPPARPRAQGTDSLPGACRDSCEACPYPKNDGTHGPKAPKPVMSEAIVRATGMKEKERRRR